tara:strand:+ start:17398 stop:17892 length:495 start_codon:yes stop_codon:yes gene_type:complete
MHTPKQLELRKERIELIIEKLTEDHIKTFRAFFKVDDIVELTGLSQGIIRPLLSKAFYHTNYKHHEPLVGVLRKCLDEKPFPQYETPGKNPLGYQLSYHHLSQVIRNLNTGNDRLWHVKNSLGCEYKEILQRELKKERLQEKKKKPIKKLIFTGDKDHLFEAVY